MNALKLLIDAKADLLEGSPGSLLHCAAKYNNTEGIKLLLQSKANINNQDDLGETSLSLAIKKKLFKSTLLLIKAKSSVNLNNNNGKSPADIALESSNKKLIEAVKEEFSKSAYSTKIRLFSALKWRETGTLKLLIAGKANLDQRDRYGDTLIHCAINYRQTDYLKLLIAGKADLEILSDRHRRPPVHSASWNRIKELKILLGAKADPNIKDGWGEPLIHRLVQNGKEDELRLIIDAKADLNIIGRNRGTALSECLNCRNNCAEILLDAGANNDKVKK